MRDRTASQSFRSFGNPAAFTLVEVLTVIGIIGVLVGFLLPTLGKAREKSRQIVCASNLRNIYAALSSYAAEHKGWVPRDCSPPDRNATSFGVIAARRLGFPDIDHTELSKVRVLQCPSHPFAGTIPDCYVSNGFAYIDDEEPPYRYSPRYSQIGLVRNASQVIYITDIADRFTPLSWGPIDLVLDVADHEAASFGHISIRHWPIRVAHRRHGEYVNALMFDGSVQSMTDEHHEMKRWDDGRRGKAGRDLFDFAPHAPH